MKLKTLALTVAALAVLSLITWFVRRPPAPPAPDPRVGQNLLDPAVISRAAEVTLENEGESLTLVKQAESQWIVPQYYDLPADFYRLSRLIAAFRESTIEKLVTSSPQRIDRLSFGNRRIALRDSAGTEIWSIEPGGDAESGGTFIRYPGESKAYLANFTLYFDTDPLNWVDKQLIDVSPDTIAGIEIAFPDEGSRTVSFTRPAASQPFVSADGRTPDANKLSNIVNLYTAISFNGTSDLMDPAYLSARAYSRTLKLTRFDGTTLTLVYSQEPEPETDEPEPNVVLTLPSSPPVYIQITDSAADATVNSLMSRRAFQTTQTGYNNLPATSAELFTN